MKRVRLKKKLEEVKDKINKLNNAYAELTELLVPKKAIEAEKEVEKQKLKLFHTFFSIPHKFFLI